MRMKYEGPMFEVSVVLGEGDRARYRTAIVGAQSIDDAIRIGRKIGDVRSCIERSFYHYFLSEGGESVG